MEDAPISKSQLKKIGEKIRKTTNPEKELTKELEIIQKWRSKHSIPLNSLQMLVRRKLKGNNHADCLCVQRLKRMPSIIGKLKRFSMDLSKMQDIGGVRIIARDIDEVRSVYNDICSLRANSSFEFLPGYKDYIKHPKDDGYRSIHQVVRYSSDKKADLKGVLLELQIRSKLEHIWATAVETYSAISSTSLKTGQGEDDVREYFSVASALFALEEGTPLHEKYSNLTKNQLISMLRNLDLTTGISKTLKSLSLVATEFPFQKDKKISDYSIILQLNVLDKQAKVLAFNREQDSIVDMVYESLEKKALNMPGMQVVLIKGYSLKQIESAYPNYFMDTKDFCKKLEEIRSTCNN